jgi:outer membrane protein OmpA-like peptidoglycan-associated protein
MKLLITAAALLLAMPALSLADASRDELFHAADGAREAAWKAEAYRLAGSAWIRAEEKLKAAEQSLGKGDARKAQKQSGEAAQLYDAAELQAIKAALLTEARGLVAALGPAGTARMAPKTTARAQSLLGQAEAELDADRSHTEAAARLAAQTASEARHAVALAAYLRAARERDATSEDLVLEWESALAKAASAAGAAADLSGGPREATDQVTAAVGGLQARADQQAQDLRQRDEEIGALEAEIRDLDSRLAGASNEAQSLSERLEAREHARAQLQRLEQIFPTDQAVVFRQGDDVIVRVQGLAFAPGSAKLTTSADPMLGKLRDVVVIYPRAMYAVEGHTDATGDSAANQRLSQSRAETVRRYLVEQAKVPAARVSAVGYGDTRPIASNGSEEGRRQNRRIDLVITPGEEAAP